MKKLVCWIFMLQLALMPAAQAASAGAAPARAEGQKNVVLQVVLDTLGQRYQRILSAVPAEVINGVDLEKKAELDAVIQERLAGLKDGTLRPEQLRQEMSRLAEEALRQRKEELKFQIHQLPAEKLDEIAATMKENLNYTELAQEYQAAYTRTEKENVIVRAVMRDLDHHFSMMNKSSRFLSKSDWIHDLSLTSAMSNTKGAGGTILRLLGYAALSLATVGLMTWGVASAVYGGKYNARKSQLDQQFSALKAELEAHYFGVAAQLNADAVEFLKSNGYVYMTCGTYEKPDSILCNRYQYALFQGSQYCSVMCWKNVATGKEAMHSTPTCTAPFIPSDCYDPAEYEQGRRDGYDDGYDRGDWDGRGDGERDGADDGYSDGYDDGYYQSYEDGYSAGFYDGYYAYTPMGFLSTLSATKKADGYQRGYGDGQADAQRLVSGF